MKKRRTAASEVLSPRGNDVILTYMGDSFAFTCSADTVVTGSDWIASPYYGAHNAAIAVSEDVIGAGRPSAYTNATTIEGAAAEAGWQIANWYAFTADDHVTTPLRVALFKPPSVGALFGRPGQSEAPLQMASPW